MRPALTPYGFEVRERIDARLMDGADPFTTFGEVVTRNVADLLSPEDVDVLSDGTRYMDDKGTVRLSAKGRLRLLDEDQVERETLHLWNEPTRSVCGMERPAPGITSGRTALGPRDIACPACVKAGA